MKSISFVALVERLSCVQHERERALATQLRSALEEREKALRMVHSLENKYVRILARFCYSSRRLGVVCKEMYCLQLCNQWLLCSRFIFILAQYPSTYYFQLMALLVLYQQFNYQLL